MIDSQSLTRLLDRLDEARRAFGQAGRLREVEELLRLLGRKQFRDSDSLIGFHEQLLFIRAYPPNSAIFQLAEKLLSSFAERVNQLLADGTDPTVFDYIEVSGMAGTTLHGTYSYGIAQWLARRYSAYVDVEWERYQKTERLAYGLPRFIPLLDEDSLVEQNIPYLEWLHSARAAGSNDLVYLIDCFDRFGGSARDRSRLYDLLELWISWDLRGTNVSRTLNRTTPRRVFYHTRPLLKRNQVSLAKEIVAPLRLRALATAEGQAIIDRCRETTCVRYRELYGIAYGDPSSVVRAEFGRGVEIYLWGLPPERRLPLRAYHSGFTLKNGVPINYIEGITIFERMELGFNTFYTYREGETAWIYAQALRMLHHIVGVTCFSIDPYQIGFNNQEALDSGAFWFYRKLGFRPTRVDLMKIAETEEKKIAGTPGYRTPARVLRKLAEAPMIYEVPGSPKGDWDSFRIRNLGLAVQHRMAREFDGDADRMRAAAMAEVRRALDLRPRAFKGVEYEAFADLALVMALIPDLSIWTRQEKKGVVRVIRAKSGGSDAQYAKSLQDHSRLRSAIIEIGSRPVKNRR
ncbi:MAG TPA: hypothetical protein VJX67_10815 [Blastocatellia bacterium]|nr:hypothetical protein [Blastocatellia bacterium]